MDIYRIVSDEMDEICTFLEERNEDFDFDNGGRLMVHKSGLNLLFASDFDYDEV